MKPFFKKLLWILGAPLVIALLMCLSSSEGILGAGLLLLFVSGTYGVIGIILLFTKEADTGKAMLLSAGIILLVGFSVCGIILSGLKLNNMH
ncbi:MAG TPA: hypothetical protein VM802_10010 [Chitinophaga sp.]|uniref:hypothetical protein n=1 Tax=Chitinophaga sp. TaxID=1869181 RepID=UPI002BF5F286|nr:hypothetical protein [Chitinophaga sp.]HVI45198.1 hypothetical protein [Chitinophaga sp.]